MGTLQPARRGPFWLVLALCLGAGALRMADLLLCTDPATGFVLRWPVLARCLALAAAVALLRLAARSAAAAPAVLARPDRALAVMLLAAGVLCAASAGTAVERLLAWAAAAGFALLAWQAGARPARGSALCGLLPLPWLLWLAAQRAIFAPSAVTRLGATLCVVSAVAALAFFAALLRLLYVPAQPGTAMLFTTGAACFLFCACIELPQTVCEWAWGAATLREMLCAGVLACLGAGGLLCAWRCTGPRLAAAPAPAGKRQRSGPAQKPERY